MEGKPSPRRTMEVSMLLIAAAQFSLSPFVIDFRISIAVTCFSAAVYFLEDVSIFSATLLSAAGTFITRTAFYCAGEAHIFWAMHLAGPEIIFSLSMGLDYHFLSIWFVAPFAVLFSCFIPLAWISYPISGK